MKRSSSFESQMLGFYFSINGLRVPESGDIPEGELDAAYAINARAYQLLDQSLPKAAVWLKNDEHEPEIGLVARAVRLEDGLGFLANRENLSA
ncbi:hypothetical protein [Stutzerimonas stutzeri]|uniref:hypothetical protein n=1 Tax=Stutzerimonas stutzeri TaxID=316 RepID=UPI001BCFC491|nr:hypothetical protein [Stutzerimonas stutzeri]